MIIYKFKLKKEGKMTIIPDSQRIFGFLTNTIKGYYDYSKISEYILDILNKKQKCMVSSLMPDGYYPFPIEYITDKYDIEKSTYKILKSINFIRKEELLNLLKNNMKLSKTSMEKIDFLEIKHEFIQKFRIESQTRNLPGLPNVSYSLDIITLVCREKEQEDFSFFVKVEENSLLKEAIGKMEKDIASGENITYLGGKASSGLNTFKVYGIKKIDDNARMSKSKTYINLGMLLPEFNKIDTENSFINIHVSDRKPYDIENNIEKAICFIRPGSIISKNNEAKDEFELVKSIHNKYNLLYKNAIIFGNSYLEAMEV